MIRTILLCVTLCLFGVKANARIETYCNAHKGYVAVEEARFDAINGDSAGYADWLMQTSDRYYDMFRSRLRDRTAALASGKTLDHRQMRQLDQSLVERSRQAFWKVIHETDNNSGRYHDAAQKIFTQGEKTTLPTIVQNLHRYNEEVRSRGQPLYMPHVFNNLRNRWNGGMELMKMGDEPGALGEEMTLSVLTSLYMESAYVSLRAEELNLFIPGKIARNTQVVEGIYREMLGDASTGRDNLGAPKHKTVFEYIDQFHQNVDDDGEDVMLPF